jgi:fibronectin type 3 domain-containing protein
MRTRPNLVGKLLLAAAIALTAATALASSGSSARVVAFEPAGEAAGAPAAKGHGAAAAYDAFPLLRFESDGAPGNDVFANAFAITGESGSTAGTNIDATEETGEPPNPAGLIVATVWWTWVAPAAGEYAFDTRGSEFDSVLAVYTGSPVNSLVLIAANDDFGGATSLVTFAATAGVTYRIQVGSVQGQSQGAVSLNWALRPANDDFGEAALLAGASGTAQGTDLGATLQDGEPSFGDAFDHTVWYAWTPPAGPAAIFVDPSDGASVAVYAGTELAGLIEVASGQESGPVAISFPAAGSTSYTIQIGALEDASPGAFSLTYGTFPGAPALGPATPGNGFVSLSWSAPATNGGSAITGYKVFRGTSAGAETELETLGNVTGYTDLDVANGTTYYYKVSAITALGEGPVSNERSATPAVLTKPGPPTLVSATPGNGSASLAWNPPASDGGASITAYEVYRGESSGAETFLDTVTSGTTYDDRTAVNGTTYYYRVAAVNSVGVGDRSNELSAMPGVHATVPAAPLLAPPTPGEGSVTLTWTPLGSGGSPITGYTIYRGASSGAETELTTVGPVTTYTDTTVASGTTYVYYVTARNAVGEGGPSNERPAITLPGTPTLDSAVAGQANVVLSWSPPASNGDAPITDYNVYRSAGGGPETMFPVGSALTTYDDTSAVTGTTYSYRVAAVNATGAGAKSNQLTATPSTVPSAPVLTQTTAGNGTVALTWSVPPSNGSPITGYKVYRAVGAGSSVLLATPGNVTSYTDNAVTNLTIYDYRISAVNALGEGPQSPIATAVPAPGVYGAPGWWSGDCDANWWNPRAQALGWQGEGAHRLGAAYLGIPVCGPRPGPDVAPGIPWSRAGQAVDEWNSSEYAFRFMNQVYGVTPYAAAPKDVVRNYTAGAGGGLQFVGNSVAGSAPQPGDVISFDNPDGVGLVAVVGWVGVDASGNGEIRIVAQNDTGPGWRRLNVTNWNVQGFNANTAYGWLHDPQGRGAGVGAPAATTPAAPVLGVPTSGNNSVTLTWSTPPNGGSPITGYTIYRGTSNGTEVLLTTVGAVNTYTDTTAVNGTTYFYRVAAVNVTGEGGASNERSATPSDDGSVRTNPVAPTVVVPRPPEPTAPPITQRPPKP